MKNDISLKSMQFNSPLCFLSIRLQAIGEIHGSQKDKCILVIGKVCGKIREREREKK